MGSVYKANPTYWHARQQLTSVVVNFFQASPKPDGKTSKIGIAEESITIERSAKLDESNGVRYVDSDDDEPNNDESDDKLGKSDVIEGVSQGPISNKHDRSPSNIIRLDAADGERNEESENDANRGNVIASPIESVDFVDNKLANKARREGANQETECLKREIVGREVTKSLPLEHWKENATEGKRVEISEISRLAARQRTARENFTKLVCFSNTEEIRTDAKTYTTDVSANPKQEMIPKYELVAGSPSKNPATEVKQAGGEMREKGHYRHASCEIPVDSKAAVQPVLTSAEIPIIASMNLEEGENPDLHIPFPGGNRSPKLFCWSGGDLGMYFVVVIEQHHAFGVGVIGLLGLVVYVACSLWT